MRFAGLAAMLALVLSGCAGAGANGAPAAARTSTAAAPSATPRTSAGVPAPEDLSGFRCDADAKGNWRASGVLQNEAKQPATYQVSVFVGRADGLATKAMTKQYARVTAGGSIKIALERVPAAKGATQCYVQVLRK